MTTDKRIKKALAILHKQAKEDPESRLDVQLFKYGLRLTLQDWKAIRGPDYWRQYDALAMEPLKQKQFTIDAIKNYLNHKKLNNGNSKQRRTKVTD